MDQKTIDVAFSEKKVGDKFCLSWCRSSLPTRSTRYKVNTSWKRLQLHPASPNTKLKSKNATMPKAGPSPNSPPKALKALARISVHFAALMARWSSRSYGYVITGGWVWKERHGKWICGTFFLRHTVSKTCGSAARYSISQSNLTSLPILILIQSCEQDRAAMALYMQQLKWNHLQQTPELSTKTETSRRSARYLPWKSHMCRVCNARISRTCDMLKKYRPTNASQKRHERTIKWGWYADTG